MSIEYASMGKFAVDLQDGAGLRAFPIQPTDLKIIRMSDPEVRLDGTENTPIYWNMELHFTVVPKQHIQTISQWWKPSNQKVRLCYMSTRYPGNPATGAAGSGWVIGDAIWRDPPITTAGQIRGVIVFDLVLKFYRVELDLDYSGGGSNGSSGGGTTPSSPAGAVQNLTVVSKTMSDITLAWDMDNTYQAGYAFQLQYGVNPQTATTWYATPGTVDGTTGLAHYEHTFPFDFTAAAAATSASTGFFMIWVKTTSGYGTAPTNGVNVILNATSAPYTA